MTVDSPDERPTSLIMKVGHYYAPLAVALMPIAWSSAGATLLPPSTALVVWRAIAVIAAFLFLGVTLAATVHNQRLCPLDVAPALDHDDPDAEVEKNRWKLRLYHQPVVAALLSLAILNFSLLRTVAGDSLPARVGFAALAVVFVAGWMTIVVGSDHAHRRLALWCPWCRHGRGGNGDPDPDLTPEPTPDPAVQARR